MDIRDVFFWAAEARRKRLARRMDAYTAALLPHQEPAMVQSVMDGLQADIEAIDQDADEIDRLDKENARLIAEANRMVKERNVRRKAKRAAGIEPEPKKKKRRPAAKGKAIR